MLRSRKFYLSLLGVVAWSATAADTVLIGLDIGLPHVLQGPLLPLPVSAVVMDAISLSAVTVFSTHYAWTKDGRIKHSTRRRRTITACCVVVSTIALLLSLASLIALRAKSMVFSSSGVVTLYSDRRFAARFATWTLTCLCQVVLYSSRLWNRPRQLQPIVVSGPRDSIMTQLGLPNRTTNALVPDPARPMSPSASPSSAFSARSSQSIRSLRESLYLAAIRPSSSRTKLIRTQISYTDVRSREGSPQVDGFDSWEVDNRDSDAIMQIPLPSSPCSASSEPSHIASPRLRGPALETIPGSRPVSPSPAHALDGPFPQDPPEYEDETLFMPSRPPSPAISEAHIHPLFRSESPIPPPAATPGTSIVASPLAEQAIVYPSRQFSRMRSNSHRAPSPPRGRSPVSYARSPLADISRSSSISRYREPSPVSREMTPPIPDFVLNSSPRSSVSQSLKRVQLHSEASP